MGWKGVTIMDQRIRFIAEYLNGYFRQSFGVRHKEKCGDAGSDLIIEFMK
jgi:hypothetical protein